MSGGLTIKPHAAIQLQFGWEDKGSNNDCFHAHFFRAALDALGPLSVDRGHRIELHRWLTACDRFPMGLQSDSRDRTVGGES